MVDDLISRHTVITQLSHNKNKGDEEWELAVENDIQTVWKIPTAKIVPPHCSIEKPKGKWLIRYFGGDAKCSNCGFYFRDVYDYENFDRFCRHCGEEKDGLVNA